ncbi:hypothetical protein IV102_37500 [bacterium]|nr:hypothetical protein [bacterium]
MLRICLLVLLLVPPAWSQRWPESVAHSLTAQPIQAARNLEQVLKDSGRPWEGSNSLWLLDLRDGTRAVFRSEDEPWGSQGEIAGYRLTRWLGLDLVPPTVFRILHQSEWPATTPWPFPQATRTGSVQIFLTVKPTTPELLANLDPLVKADIEVVSFVMGRYDNHSGNLLVDEQGHPCLIDFENSLEIQQARYGDIPYARRGARRTDLPGLSARQPFPFDHPEKLVDPSLEEIQKRLSPWWTYWPEGMAELHRHIRNLDDKTIRYAIWDHRLWVQARATSRHPAWTDRYRNSTMERLSQLDEGVLQLLLPVPYTHEHVRTMLGRAHQVLEAWRQD